jgi:spore coat polysaccharide biosynthesis protein SpsF
MTKTNEYCTEQEDFWAGEFGDEYIDRNPEEQLLINRRAMFNTILSKTTGVESVIEFGANIGSNLIAINQLKPDAEISAVEINAKAVARLKENKIQKIYHQSILDFNPDYNRNFVFTSGVLIHINPDALPGIYQSLYETSNKYICVIEYYNPTPVQKTYRGHDEKLFKRDFAGEMLDTFSDLHLVDYGFVYHRDNNFPLGDPTWFLMEKRTK